jgi:hypothetical protein
MFQIKMCLNEAVVKFMFLSLLGTAAWLGLGLHNLPPSVPLQRFTFPSHDRVYVN